jgi:hypothetical protein
VIDVLLSLLEVCGLLTQETESQFALSRQLLRRRDLPDQTFVRGALLAPSFGGSTMWELGKGGRQPASTRGNREMSDGCSKRSVIAAAVMQLPRTTTRRWMIAVAFVGVVMGGIIVDWPGS